MLTNDSLKTVILESVIEEPNALGEALLKYSFVGEGRGCYSNFTLRDSFKKYDKGKLTFANFLVGVWPDDLLECAEYKAGVEEISCFKDEDTGLIVAWLWDGDGSLAFLIDEKKKIFLENSDIKKSYNWMFA